MVNRIQEVVSRVQTVMPVAGRVGRTKVHFFNVHDFFFKSNESISNMPKEVQKIAFQRVQIAKFPGPPLRRLAPSGAGHGEYDVVGPSPFKKTFLIIKEFIELSLV